MPARPRFVSLLAWALAALAGACTPPPSLARCCDCLASSASDVDTNGTGLPAGGNASCLNNQRADACEEQVEGGAVFTVSEACLDDFCGAACDGIDGFVAAD